MEVIACGAFRGEVVGQRVPGAAVVEAIEDSVDELAQVGRARRSGRNGGREEGLKDSPLQVGEVRGVGLTRGRGVHVWFSQKAGEAVGCSDKVVP